MAITSSAKKALRASNRKAIFNTRHQKDFRDAIKKLKKLAADGKAAEARAALSVAYKAIDKAAKTNVIKKNNASRKKSRLSALIKRSIKK